MRVRVWEVKVGRTRLLLLDTNSPHNRPDDRNITYRLYGGDRDYRCKQEIVLGIGGFYALQALGLAPTIYHMNEGHSAFMGLARIADLRRKTKLSFAEAREACAATSVFTTHTPVPAGFDVFSKEQLDRFLPRIHEELGIERRELYRLGAHENDPAPSAASTWPTWRCAARAASTASRSSTPRCRAACGSACGLAPTPARCPSSA
ncbi:MAG: hypothetical protein U1F43_18055 [Myxococcota bacterium]